jgi:hypothetical protein
MNLFIRTSLLAVAFSTPAWSAAETGQFSRLPESVQRIETETGGKVLQVRPIQRGDREIYRMKVLTPEGRVRVVQDDPRHPRDHTPPGRDPDPGTQKRPSRDDGSERRR